MIDEKELRKRAEEIVFNFTGFPPDKEDEDFINELVKQLKNIISEK